MGNMFSMESDITIMGMTISPMMVMLLIGAVVLLGVGLYYIFTKGDKEVTLASTFIGKELAKSPYGGASFVGGNKVGKTSKGRKRGGRKRTARKTTKRKGKRKTKGGMKTGSVVTRR